MARQEHSLGGQALGTKTESKIIHTIWVYENADVSPCEEAVDLEEISP